MKLADRTIDAFFALLRAGLWEQGVRVLPFEPLDFEGIYQLADDQAVVGLVAAGLEHVEDRKIVKPEALPFLKKVFAQEGRNSAMNAFLEREVTRMRKAGIDPLLVKGQGVAQCYARPQWRSAGDIDFFVDADNYLKAKPFLSKGAESIHPEGIRSKHFCVTIEGWTVELHGRLRCGLSVRSDKVIDSVQADTFKNRNIRTWRNGETDIYLPGPDNDVIFVFTHILKHFYVGGIGLRQICDWCRLLWTYRDSMDVDMLEQRLRSMGFLSEWRAFAAFAVDSLGMPAEAMPLYAPAPKWSRKASRIRDFILKVGNFGMNRDMSYYEKYPYLVRKTISFGRRCGDLVRHATIFPMDSLRFFPAIVLNGLQSAARGEG